MKTTLLVLAGFYILLTQNFYSQVLEKDIIYLKNGEILQGVITEISAEGNVTVCSSSGKLLKYSMNEIGRIVKENKEVIESNEKSGEGQTKQGNISLGGFFFFSGGETKENIEARGPFGQSFREIVFSDFKEFTAGPSLGYFFIDNLSINLAINFAKVKTDHYTTEYYSGVFSLKYYFGSQDSKPFITGGAVIYKDKYEGSGGFMLGAGYNAALTRNMAVQPIFQYQSYNRTENEAGVLSSFSLGISAVAYIF